MGVGTPVVEAGLSDWLCSQSWKCPERVNRHLCAGGQDHIHSLVIQPVLSTVLGMGSPV